MFNFDLSETNAGEELIEIGVEEGREILLGISIHLNRYQEVYSLLFHGKYNVLPK